MILLIFIPRKELFVRRTLILPLLSYLSRINLSESLLGCRNGGSTSLVGWIPRDTPGQYSRRWGSVARRRYPWVMIASNAGQASLNKNGVIWDGTRCTCRRRPRSEKPGSKCIPADIY